MGFGGLENIDVSALCPVDTHWDGNECVPDAAPAALPPADIDFAALAAQYPDIFGGAGPTVTPPPVDIGGPQGLGGAGTTAGLNDAAVLAWLAEEGAQNLLGGGPTAATDTAPPPVDTTDTTPAPVNWYEQTIVEPGLTGQTSDAEAAWLDAAINSGLFMGDLGAVEGEGYSLDPDTGYILDASGKIMQGGGTWSPYEMDAYDLNYPSPELGIDERYQGRIDFAEDLLDQGFTVADIEQFMGVESVDVGDAALQAELGTVAGERLDDFAGVGTKEWFEFLADDPDVMADPELAQGVTDALASIEETGTATKTWMESPEFKEKYGGGPEDDDPVVAKTPQQLCVEGGNTWVNGMCDMGGGTVLTPEQLCVEEGGTWNGTLCDTGGGGEEPDPSGCDPGYKRNASGQCVLIEEITDGDACPAGQMRDATGKCVDIPPSGVPTFVKTQVDALNIVDNKVFDIKKAINAARDAGLLEIEGIEKQLRDAELAIYEDQYGTFNPLTGERLTSGEFDRLRQTYASRKKTSKTDRQTDRAQIEQIMVDDGVAPALAKSQMDMITALHGDSVDAMYDYIDSLWRIGQMSHDERDSMITNMMASYSLELRDRAIELIMGEEITGAEETADLQQQALEADTLAGLFPDLSEDQVYAMLTGGLENLLELPEKDPTGTIDSGPWQGYTKGQQANAFLNKGYEYNADDDTWTLPKDDPILGMIESGVWAGYTEAERSDVLARAGWTLEGEGENQKWVPPVEPDATADAAEPTYSRTLPDGTPWTGTAAEYFRLTGDYLFAEEDAVATVDVRISELNYPYGGFEVKRSRDGRDVITVTADELNMLLTSGTFKPVEDIEGPKGWIDEENFTQGTTGMTVVDGQVQLPMSLINSMVSAGMIDISEAEVAEGTIPIAVQRLRDLGATEEFLGDYDILGTGEDEHIRLTPDDFFQRFPRDNPYAPGEEPEGELPVTVAHMERLGMGTPEQYGWTVQGDEGSEYVMITQSDWQDVAPGQAMFSPSPLYQTLVPSGIMVDDFPDLKAALEAAGVDVTVTEEQYWLTPDDIRIYGEIAGLQKDATDTRNQDLGGWMTDGPYTAAATGVNWPVAAPNMIRQAASQLAANPDYEGFAAVDLQLAAVLANAGKDGPRSSLASAAPAPSGSWDFADATYVYSRLAAKYLQRDIPIYDTPYRSGDVHAGHIKHTDGTFVLNPAFVQP